MHVANGVCEWFKICFFVRCRVFNANCIFNENLHKLKSAQFFFFGFCLSENYWRDRRDAEETKWRCSSKVSVLAIPIRVSRLSDQLTERLWKCNCFADKRKHDIITIHIRPFTEYGELSVAIFLFDTRICVILIIIWRKKQTRRECMCVRVRWVCATTI